jgi:tryptophan synthase alpha subunit
VTGAGNLDTAAVAEAVPRIRQHVKVPVGVGFGIRDAASAQAVGRVSDGVVIGSRLIQLIENEPASGCRRRDCFSAGYPQCTGCAINARRFERSLDP